jgi:hypothetical protein
MCASAAAGRQNIHQGKEVEMKVWKYVPLVCLVIMAMGCNPITVKHDYELDTDFSNLKTYDWMPDPGKTISNVNEALVNSSLLEKRVKSAVDRRLKAQGYQIVEKTPDFRVIYYLSVREKLRDWGTHYDGRLREIQKGTLILDFVDPESMEIVWRGVAQKTVDPKATPEQTEKNINEAVSKLLDGFPPKGK